MSTPTILDPLLRFLVAKANANSSLDVKTHTAQQHRPKMLARFRQGRRKKFETRHEGR
jgi:hypothetical protein